MSGDCRYGRRSTLIEVLALSGMVVNGDGGVVDEPSAGLVHHGPHRHFEVDLGPGAPEARWEREDFSSVGGVDSLEDVDIAWWTGAEMVVADETTE